MTDAMDRLDIKRESDFEFGLESEWIDPALSPQDATHISLGVDVGSVSTQAVLMADDAVYAYSNLRGGAARQDSGRRAIDRVLEKTGLGQDTIHFCVGTGYGRVNIPFSDKNVTEISCVARGARYMFGPSMRSVLDVGGQDIKMIHCDEQGKVVNFHMNDKCGAGTGRGMESLSEFLGVPLDRIGERSLTASTPPSEDFPKCVIYARSEAVNRVRKGDSVEAVLADFCRAMAQSIFEVVKKPGVLPEFAVTGGMAKNRGVIDRVLSLLSIRPLQTPWDPQIAGALGAAIFARTLAQKGKKRKQK